MGLQARSKGNTEAIVAVLCLGECAAPPLLSLRSALLAALHPAGVVVVTGQLLELDEGRQVNGVGNRG